MKLVKRIIGKIIFEILEQKTCVNLFNKIETSKESPILFFLAHFFVS